MPQTIDATALPVRWSLAADHADQGLAALDQFIAREGHARVPASTQEAGFNVGLWVIIVRTDQQDGTLNASCRERLDALPEWSWEMPEDPQDPGLQALHAFVAREGHTQVPQAHHEGAFHLGRWVDHHRQERAQGVLPPQKVEQLEFVPEWAW